MIFFVALLLWLTASGSLLLPTQILDPSSSELITASCTTGDTVLISTNAGSIYNISLNRPIVAHLYYQFTGTLSGVNYGGMIASNEEEGIVIACLFNTSCYQLNDKFITSLLYKSQRSARSTRMVMLQPSNGRVYTGYYGSFNNFPLMYFLELNVNGTLRYGAYLTSQGNFARKFVAGFAADTFAYFVAEDQRALNDVVVVRMCEDTNISETTFNAFYEIHLKTLPVSATSTLVNSQLVTMETVPMVMITLSYEGNCVGGIYWYRLDDINSQMEESFEACISGADKIKIPWMTHIDRETCAQFGEVR